MSTRRERATALIETIGGALLDAGIGTEALPAVTVTDDPVQVDRRGAGLHGLVYIAPAPRFEFPVPGVTQLVWTVYVLAKPGPMIPAMDTVDPLLDALIACPDLQIETAEPGEYTPIDDMSPAMPGYVIFLQDTYY